MSAPSKRGSVSAGPVKTALASWGTEELARIVVLQHGGHDPQLQQMADMMRQMEIDGSMFADDASATECVRLLETLTKQDLIGAKLSKLVSLFRDLRTHAEKEVRAPLLPAGRRAPWSRSRSPRTSPPSPHARRC